VSLWFQIVWDSKLFVESLNLRPVLPFFAIASLGIQPVFLFGEPRFFLFLELFLAFSLFALTPVHDRVNLFEKDADAGKGCLVLLGDGFSELLERLSNVTRLVDR
jgi:hypothetical protein